ncbi:hypothetical protein NDU88_003386 [Pleurodeles waltl]|uniref:Uncharacterized protein n=1 Tax=Pleurodeles waltl TaxID=8319 RepID=A0AAV7RGM6_PLEWA|nr:hypothetical protein NDU88_003386 [Pleurodeles waltl]
MIRGRHTIQKVSQPAAAGKLQQPVGPTRSKAASARPRPASTQVLQVSRSSEGAPRVSSSAPRDPSGAAHHRARRRPAPPPQPVLLTQTSAAVPRLCLTRIPAKPALGAQAPTR